MNGLNVRIQYLYHSGFVVETNNYILIFDYYQGLINLKDLGDKPIIVFSSHAHPDHFNPLVLEWQNERSGIHYIFSSDINIPREYENIKFISPYDEIEVKTLKIKGFNSTDEGVSFLVRVDGIDLFHAGDLNWWYWWDDFEEEIVKAEISFKEEITKIKGESIDIAFFPVDPRLEHNVSIGAEYFVKEVKPKYLIPMHFADNYEAPERFAQKMKDCPTNVMTITHRGQVIQL